MLIEIGTDFSPQSARPFAVNYVRCIDSGYMETTSSGKLPEPVTLIGPADGDTVDANGAVLSCEESENAISYQLLFGWEPHRVMDYFVISETPTPPT